MCFRYPVPSQRLLSFSVPSTVSLLLFFFFFNDTATTEIYTLSLHDALPISGPPRRHHVGPGAEGPVLLRLVRQARPRLLRDRKSTRLNSSHVRISYAVFCLKKKKKTELTSMISLSQVPG